MRLLFIDHWLSGRLSHALGWTFIHSLWQGLVAAALVAVVIFFTRRSSARLRHNLFACTLVLFMFGAVITFLLQWSGYKEIQGMIEADPVLFVQSLPVTIAPVPDSSPSLFAIISGYLNSYAGWISAAWLVFFIIKSIRLFAGIQYTYRIRTYRVQQPSPRWNIKVNDLAKYIGIDQYIRLVESPLVNVPAAVGFLKPVILVPVGLLMHLTPEQAETILLHELAHIRRHDYLVNLVQSFMEAIFFFNPAVVWISSLLQEERESCCDDIVMENTTAKKSYLEALVSFHERPLPPDYAMTLFRNRTHLLDRVKRMLTRENKKLNNMEKCVLLVGITVFTAFNFIPAENNRIAPVTASSGKIVAPVETAPTNVQRTELKSQHVRAAIKRHNTIVLSVQSEAVKTDTVPAPPTPLKTENIKEQAFSSLSVSQTKNETIDEQTVEASDKNGDKYRYKKTKGKIESFSMNDKEIAESQWPAYADIISNMERAAGAPRAKFKTYSSFKANNRFDSLKLHRSAGLKNSMAPLKLRSLDTARLMKRHQDILKQRLINIRKDSVQLVKYNSDMKKLSVIKEKLISSDAVALNEKKLSLFKLPPVTRSEYLKKQNLFQLRKKQILSEQKRRVEKRKLQQQQILLRRMQSLPPRKVALPEKERI